jgi:hypothetical protein
MPRTQAQKKANLKYVESHRELICAISRKSSMKTYENRRSYILAYKACRYQYKLEIKRLCNMFDAISLP